VDQHRWMLRWHRMVRSTFVSLPCLFRVFFVSNDVRLCLILCPNLTLGVSHRFIHSPPKEQQTSTDDELLSRLFAPDKIMKKSTGYVFRTTRTLAKSLSLIVHFVCTFVSMRV
jgi:hypothetical protein